MTDALPTGFVERMRTLLGSEADAFFAAFDRDPPIGLRVNVLKLRPEHMERISPWDIEPVPWCDSGFFVQDADARPGKHPYHAAGLYYLQEPSAMAVVEALQVRPNQRVLDLAAAPGGKATQIAAALDGTGVLIANEVEGSRIKGLGENLERWGARNVVLTSETPERLAQHFGASFDRVLLDAPCSGEGMFRKRSHARQEWSAQHVAGCAVRQEHILAHAAQLVAPGGLLVYSTCTFAPEENEQRIAAFLHEYSDWSLIEIPKRYGFAPGRPEWSDPALPELSKTARLWPHRLQGEGHFIALLRNDGRATHHSGETPWSLRGWRGWGRKGQVKSVQFNGFEPASADALMAWRAWERATLTTTVPEARLLQKGDLMYQAPADLPDLGSLKVVRAGLWFGTLKPGRFEPSHALALALQPDEAQQTVALRDDAVIDRYLRGETLAIEGPDGWALVTVNGWPIGWGRRISGVVKNFYPKGLRAH